MAEHSVDFNESDLKAIANAGYVKKAFIDHKSARQLAKQVKAIFEEDDYREFIWADQFGGDHRLFGIENIIPEISSIKVSLDQKFERLYGGKVVSTFLAQHVKASDRNEGSGGKFHRDSQRTQYKAFVYLTETTPESGALQIVDHSHKMTSKLMECFKQRKVRLDITTPEIPKSELSIISAGVGDVLFCDTSCIHRGSPGLKSDRINLTLYAYREGKMPPHIHSRIFRSD